MRRVEHLVLELCLFPSELCYIHLWLWQLANFVQKYAQLHLLNLQLNYDMLSIGNRIASSILYMVIQHAGSENSKRKCDMKRARAIGKSSHTRMLEYLQCPLNTRVFARRKRMSYPYHFIICNPLPIILYHLTVYTVILQPS